MKNPSVKFPFIALTWLLAMSNVARAAPYYVAPDLTGTVVDAQTKQPLSYAVIQAAWAIRAEETGKPKTVKTKRLYVRQINSGPGGRFEVPGWKAMGPEWKLIPGQDPLVHIYAKGYQRLTLENHVKDKDAKQRPANPDAIQGKWAHEGAVLALKPLAGTTDALAKELALWKKDLETEIEQSPSQDRNEAIRKQERLLFLFDDQCKTLPEAKRKSLCYGADSEFGRYLAQAMAERLKYLIIEERDGEIKKLPLKAGTAPAAIAAPVQAGAATDSSPKVGYSGISRPGVSEPVPAGKH